MLRKRPQGSFIIFLVRVTMDIAVLAGSFLFAYWLRFYSGAFAIPKGVPSFKEYYHLVPVMCLIVVFFMRGAKLYSDRRAHSEFDELVDITKSVTTAMFVLMAMTFLYREFEYSRGLIVIAWATNMLFISAWRLIFTGALNITSRASGHKRRFLVIGTGHNAKEIAGKITAARFHPYKLIGLLDPDHGHSEHAGDFKVLGKIHELGEIITKQKIDEVIVADTKLSQAKMVEVVLECEKKMVAFKIMPDLLGIMTNQVDTQTLYGTTLLGLKDSPLNSATNRLLKRCIDIGGSLFGLIIFAIPFSVIAMIIKKDSKGPVFYRQERIGEDGSSFWIYKFRTMRTDAEKETGPVWAKEDDPRRTRIGSFLRKYNIDELPQLINVLKGDMSLVGPRPERPHFVSQFKEDVPRYMARHKIKSGITGWAQVNGLRGDTSIGERTKYDLYYIENWSLLFDFKIILMSLSKAAFKNAY